MTSKNLVFFLLIIFATVFFQSSALNILVIAHIKPDLVLIVACYIGLFWGEEIGTCLGFSLGLLQDIFSGGLLGLNALTKTLFSYLCGKAGKRLNIKNMVVQIVLIALFSILEGMLFLIVLRIFHLRKEIHETFLHLVLPQTLYTMVLTPIIFRLMNILRQKWAI